MTQMAPSSPVNSQQWRRESPAMSLFCSIIVARETAVKKRTDNEIRIWIPLHILASLPLAKKMTAKKKGGRKSGKGNYLPDETMFLLDILQRVKPIGVEN